MKALVLIASAMLTSPWALADIARVDARTLTCGDFQEMVAANGFVFDTDPAFDDFVVSNASFCGSTQKIQLRSVQTSDDPECVVNYCIDVNGGG